MMLLVEWSAGRLTGSSADVSSFVASIALIMSTQDYMNGRMIREECLSFSLLSSFFRDLPSKPFKASLCF